MKNRKFRGDRLYKIAKIVVVLLTIYFAFNAIDSYSGLGTAQMARESCAPNEYYTQCLKNSLIILSNIENSIRNNTFIAILLPVVFFGGTALYQYLFTIQDQLTTKELPIRKKDYQ